MRREVGLASIHLHLPSACPGPALPPQPQASRPAKELQQRWPKLSVAASTPTRAARARFLLCQGRYRPSVMHPITGGSPPNHYRGQGATS
jgi:hypothetical protein